MKIDGFDSNLRNIAQQPADGKAEQPAEQSPEPGLANFQDAIIQEDSAQFDVIINGVLNSSDRLGIPTPHFGIPQVPEMDNESPASLNPNVFAENDNPAAETSVRLDNVLQEQEPEEPMRNPGGNFGSDDVDRVGIPTPKFGIPQPSKSEDQPAVLLNPNAFSNQSDRQVEVSELPDDLAEMQEKNDPFPSEIFSNVGPDLSLNDVEHLGFAVPKFGIPKPPKSEDQSAVEYNPNVVRSDDDDE